MAVTEAWKTSLWKRRQQSEKKKKKKMKEWEFQLLLGKGWKPLPHSLLGNPQLSWEPHDPVFRRNVLSAGGRALSFKRGWGETHCPAYRHLNWSVFTLTFSTAATDTSQTWDCVKCEIAHVNISTVRRAYAGTPHLFIYFSFYCPAWQQVTRLTPPHQYVVFLSTRVASSSNWSAKPLMSRKLSCNKAIVQRDMH